MGRPLQATLELAQRRKLVAEEYLAGNTQTAIANNVGVNQSTVSRDLQAIGDDWRTAGVRDFEKARSVAYHRLLYLYREAVEAFERSKEDEMTTKTYNDRAGNQIHVKITRTRYGSARLLQAALNCLDKQCKLLGLYVK